MRSLSALFVATVLAGCGSTGKYSYWLDGSAEFTLTTPEGDELVHSIDGLDSQDALDAYLHDREFREPVAFMSTRYGSVDGRIDGVHARYLQISRTAHHEMMDAFGLPVDAYGQPVRFHCETDRFEIDETEFQDGCSGRSGWVDLDLGGEFEAELFVVNYHYDEETYEGTWIETDYGRLTVAWEFEDTPVYDKVHYGGGDFALGGTGF